MTTFHTLSIKHVGVPSKCTPFHASLFYFEGRDPLSFLTAFPAWSFSTLIKVDPYSQSPHHSARWRFLLLAMPVSVVAKVAVTWTVLSCSLFLSLYLPPFLTDVSITCFTAFSSPQFPANGALSHPANVISSLFPIACLLRHVQNTNNQTRTRRTCREVGYADHVALLFLFLPLLQGQEKTHFPSMDSTNGDERGKSAVRNGAEG